MLPCFFCFQVTNWVTGGEGLSLPGPKKKNAEDKKSASKLTGLILAPNIRDTGYVWATTVIGSTV